MEKVLNNKVHMFGRRIIVSILIVLSVSLFVVSLFFPYWKFTLFAPQYPEGLRVRVYLNKVEGDVRELDLLNHYIGMKPMEEAAKFERKIALYGVSAISLMTLLFLFSGRKLMTFFALPSIFFPLVFIGDMVYWLWNYGHDLSPHAAIKIKPFMPAFIGTGKVAQFSTKGEFGLGFYFAMLAALIVIVASFLRWTVCSTCPFRAECPLFCPKGFMFGEKIKEK